MTILIGYIVGLVIGVVCCTIYHYNLVKLKNDVIEDFKKGIKIHNYRELRLIFINQSIKEYVKQQQNILKSNPIKIKDMTDENSILAGKYMAFKDIERAITQLEKNSEDLIKE